MPRRAATSLWLVALSMLLLLRPGAAASPSSLRYTVNDRSQVVGWYYSPKSGQHAFLWEKGAMRQFSASSDSMAFGINNAGLVVGSAPYLNGGDGTMHIAAFLDLAHEGVYAALNRVRA